MIALNDLVPVSKVCDLIDQGNHQWNMPLLSHLFPPNTIRRILETPIRWSAGNDQLWWPHTTNGVLSVCC